MKKIVLNPINYITLAILIVIMVVANHKVNIEPNILINNAYEIACSDKDDIIEEYILEKCKLLEQGEKTVKLNFTFVYENLQHETMLLFFSLLIVFLVLSTIKFHRYVHTGFVKYILTRDKYRNFIMRESLHSLFTGIFLFTIYFISVFFIAYFSSEEFINVNYSKIIIEYFNTLLYFILAILISITLLKRISNLVLYILMMFLLVISLHLTFDLFYNILKIITKNRFILDLADSFFLPVDTDMKFYFIPQILLNVLLSYVVIIAYKNKEEFIIELEK